MSGIALLTVDLLADIMLRASSIEDKFALAQVSHLWRCVALDAPLLWSYFTGGASKADCYRVPLVLARTGTTTKLHIHFCFDKKDAAWPAAALAALVPYAVRIETLDVEFASHMPIVVTPLLNSNLNFPALRTLRLNGPEYARPFLLSVSAPQLRTLDLHRIDTKTWNTLLVPTLEDVRLCESGDSGIETLSDVFAQCPRVERLVLQSDHRWSSQAENDVDFDVFARRPLAPALKELELRLDEQDLERVLKIGFSDVVLDSVSGSIYNGHSPDEVELLSRALLPGLGPLRFFEWVDYTHIELRDNGGHIRHMECWNEDSNFELPDVWQHLSEKYNLHKTVLRKYGYQMGIGPITAMSSTYTHLRPRTVSHLV
ncbi:hypothetical protein C8R43DRAFT_908170 [Mycena crocata]|nr:hypothetical protein C8R43DRAFT_908170 [Mycena crocata]